MNEFNQANIEKWLQDFVASAPLTCANAEKLNVMSMAMKNLSFMPLITVLKGLHQ